MPPAPMSATTSYGPSRLPVSNDIRRARSCSLLESRGAVEHDGDVRRSGILGRRADQKPLADEYPHPPTSVRCPQIPVTRPSPADSSVSPGPASEDWNTAP